MSQEASPTTKTKPDTLLVDPSIGPEKSASFILDKLAVNQENKTIRIPIDVDGIAQDLGLKVERMALPDNTDGLLVKTEAFGKFKAVIDIFMPPQETRFTLAHEIGHFILSYQDFPENKIGGVLEHRQHPDGGANDDERWADRFAASLLMPAGIVIRMWAEGRSVELMASQFLVSEEALRRRVKELGLR